MVGILQGQQLVDQLFCLRPADGIASLDRRLAGHGSHLLQDQFRCFPAAYVGKIVQHVQEHAFHIDRLKIGWNRRDGKFLAAERLHLITEQQYPLSALLCDGGRVAYEGNVLTLRCDPNIDRTRISEDAKELCVKLAATARREDVSAIVQKWLKARFAERMAERVSYWVNKTGLQPKKVSASNAKTLWGSCSRNGSIRLSCRLICLPPAVFDYIIVHELVHLRHFDHSQAFWEEVNAIYPETPSVRRYLKNVRAADLF